MSDNIPFELQEKIIKTLPVKSLLQFRSVSKAWKSLIESSDFIAAHTLRHTQPQQRLIITYHRGNETETWKNCVTFVDDDHKFPKPWSHLVIPWSFLNPKSKIVGSSHGLLCLFGDLGDSSHNFRAEICNPLVRKSIAIDVSDASSQTVLGFGVCPVTSDPKIIKITHSSLPLKIDVYTLSSGNWRNLSKNLPGNSITFTWSQVVIDKFIYWSAYDMIAIDEIDNAYVPLRLIMSFDMTTESFQCIDLPGYMKMDYADTMSICKLRESLVVLVYDEHTANHTCDVWIMDHGDQNSFKRLHHVWIPNEAINILGFRKSGELIMETVNDYKDDDEPSPLVVYEHYPGHSEELGIYGKEGSFTMNSYVESLLLLGRSDCYSY